MKKLLLAAGLVLLFVGIVFADSIRITNQTLAATDTWYSYAIPAQTLKLVVSAQAQYDFYVATTAALDAHEVVLAGEAFDVEMINSPLAGTLYFRSPYEAGLVIQMRAIRR